jgi:hypothetical protein
VWCDPGPQGCGPLKTLCVSTPAALPPASNDPAGKLPTITDFPAAPPPPPNFANKAVINNARNNVKGSVQTDVRSSDKSTVQTKAQSNARSQIGGSIKGNTKRDVNATLSRRVPQHPPGPNSPILQPQFANIEAMSNADRNNWYAEAHHLVSSFSAGNAADANGNGIASSRVFDMRNLNHPFITGAGPSWGCTTVLVVSDRGIYLAHFWEVNQIQHGMPGVLDFLHNGNPAMGHDSLTATNAQFFDRSPATPKENRASFVLAFIFTPNYENVPDDPPPLGYVDAPRDGRPPTDPTYYNEIAAISSELVRIVPGLAEPLPAGMQGNSRVFPVTYRRPDEIDALGLTPDSGIFVVDYVNAHVHRKQDGQCFLTRAIRFHRPGLPIIGPLAMAWLGPTQQQPQQKRAAAGECPANIQALLDAQGKQGHSTDETFFDPNGALGAASGSNPAGSTGQTTTSPTPQLPLPAPSTTAIVTTPVIPAAPGPMCSHFQLPPASGGSPLGWGCEGHPPQETVTFPPTGPPAGVKAAFNAAAAPATRANATSSGPAKALPTALGKAASNNMKKGSPTTAGGALPKTSKKMLSTTSKAAMPTRSRRGLTSTFTA